MAQTQSIYNNPLSGNLGNQTYKNYGGKQVITTRFRTTSAKGDGASRAQRDTRMLMPNLTLIGSQLGQWLPALWENNKFFKRPYTHFISHNMKRTLPVLPKSMIDEKRCVWGDLQASCGTLPPISYSEGSSSALNTDVRINNSGALANLNWGTLSRSIISLNSNFADGDSIVFIRAAYAERDVGLDYSIVTCTSQVSALRLDVNSNVTLANSWIGPAIALSGVSAGSSGYVIALTYAIRYSWAIVHVRKSRGRYLSSSQFMSGGHFGSEALELMAQPSYLDFCASSWGYKDRIL